MNFKVLAVDKQTKARCGEIELANGKIPTPVFMPRSVHKVQSKL